MRNVDSSGNACVIWSIGGTSDTFSLTFDGNGGQSPVVVTSDRSTHLPHQHTHTIDILSTQTSIIYECYYFVVFAGYHDAHHSLPLGVVVVIVAVVVVLFCVSVCLGSLMGLVLTMSQWS